MGIAKTAYEGAMGVLDIASNFIPGGKAIIKIGKVGKAMKSGAQAVKNRFS